MKTANPIEPKPLAADYKRIAESIGRVSDSAKALRASGLSRKATVALIKHSTGISQKDIELVLYAAEDLRRWCLSQT